MLNPDAHMFFNKAVEEKPMLMSTIMMHISIKAGLNQWGNKVIEVIKSEMRQFHLKNN